MANTNSCGDGCREFFLHVVRIPFESSIKSPSLFSAIASLYLNHLLLYLISVQTLINPVEGASNSRRSVGSSKVRGFGGSGGPSPPPCSGGS